MIDLQPLTSDFLRDDAGSPLGPGMPSGAPLRTDGQSHYEAWQALLRRDPCSYCDTRAGEGTVDHVDPRSRAARGVGTVHGWINTVGACARCNGAKRDLGLLVFLHRRRWSAAAHPGEPARATRRVARRWPDEAIAHLRVGRADRRAGGTGRVGGVGSTRADADPPRAHRRTGGPPDAAAPPVPRAR